MNRRLLLLIVSLFLLPLGCGGNDDPNGPTVPLVLEPSEFCSDHSDAAVATFEDANLEAAITTALSVGAQEDLTCGLVSGLTELDAWSLGITSLMGVQNLTSLTSLHLSDNSISNISALSGLTGLTGQCRPFFLLTDTHRKRVADFREGVPRYLPKPKGGAYPARSVEN